MRPETLFVHAGAEPDAATGAVVPPLHLSTTYQHGPAGERVAGFEYVREGNPNQAQLETALAALEGGAAALAFASGMAAITALLDSLPAGAHLIYPQDCYSGLRVLVTEFLQQRGVSATAVDVGDIDAVRAALTPLTRCCGSRRHRTHNCASATSRRCRASPRRKARWSPATTRLRRHCCNSR